MRPLFLRAGRWLSEDGEEARQELLAAAQEHIEVLERTFGDEPVDEVIRPTLRNLRVWAARLHFLETPRRRGR
jgi:hypothetical protein